MIDSGLSYTAAMKNDKFKIPVWMSAAATAIAFLLGYGMEYKNANTERAKAQVERLKAAQDFRKSEEAQLQKIISLADDYMGAEREYSKHPTSELHRKFVQLKAQLDMVKDDFRVIESNLATLEDRQPRNVNIEFIPPNPPTLLTPTVR